MLYVVIWILTRVIYFLSNKNDIDWKYQQKMHLRINLLKKIHLYAKIILPNHIFPKFIIYLKCNAFNRKKIMKQYATSENVHNLISKLFT